MTAAFGGTAVGITVGTGAGADVGPGIGDDAGAALDSGAGARPGATVDWDNGVDAGT